MGSGLVKGACRIGPRTGLGGLLGCGSESGPGLLSQVNGRVAGSCGNASPTLVGRVEEFQTLQAARVRAADGEPAVVLVPGEAGVGKTRLVAELMNRCAANGTRVLVGGCVPADSRRPCGGHGQDRATANPRDDGRARRSTLRREVELQSSPLPAT